MSENLRQTTVDSYNNSAQALAEYFRGIGPREYYIDKAIELAGSLDNPRILEIGCGDGRDAKAVARRTTNYLGIDISEKMVGLAREHVPEGQFEVADVAEYEFPDNLDVILAFASILHLNKRELAAVFGRAAKALRPGGIFYISTKYRPSYSEEIKQDQFGKRLFYFYNTDEIAELAGPNYEVAESWREIHGHTDWVEIALKKVDAE